MSVDFYSCLLSCSCLWFQFMSVMILDILYLLFMSADYFYVYSWLSITSHVKTGISFQCFSNSRHGFPHVNDMCIIFHCFSNSRHVFHSFCFISYSRHVCLFRFKTFIPNRMGIPLLPLFHGVYPDYPICRSSNFLSSEPFVLP